MGRCYELGELLELDGQPADDPRRRHLRACPRCRALLHAHAQFLAPDTTDDLPGLADADRELEGRLAAAVGAAPEARPGRRAWFAAAAVLAACALGLAATDLMGPGNEPPPSGGTRLRGTPPTQELIVTAAADGLRVDWPDVPPADHVVYVFSAPDLAELGRRTVTGPALVLAATDPLTAAVFCQAFAVAQGDTVARSAIVRIPPVRE